MLNDYGYHAAQPYMRVPRQWHQGKVDVEMGSLLEGIPGELPEELLERK